MRVVVNIPKGSHPELLHELQKAPPRERAERLRMLATFGIIQMIQANTRFDPSSTEKGSFNSSKDQPDNEGNPLTEMRKQMLKSKLGIET